MKKIIFAMAILLATTTATFAQAKKSTTYNKHHKNMPANKFTCTMHPEVVKSKPGKCPKCGMALVPVKKKIGNGKRSNTMHT